MTTLACRACRAPLTSPDGCDICRPVKSNLSVVGDSPADRVDLGELTTEALIAARDRLAFLSGLKPDDKRFDARQMLELIRTIAVMADATRKIRKEGVAAVNAMTFQEKAALFSEWYATLPRAHRDYVREEMAKVAPPQ